MSYGGLGPLHWPGIQLGRLPSAALLGPFAPALTFNRPPIFLMLSQVLINGGCWVETPAMTAEMCAENDYVLLQGKCYAPALELPRRPLPNLSDAQAP